jgi:O-antigen ligase
MGSIAYAFLWLFVFCVPWEGVIRISGVSVASRATGALALGITMLVVLMTGRLRRWNVMHVAALVFILCAGLTLLMRTGNPKMPAKYYTFVQLFAVLWMLWQLAPTRRALYGLMFSYVLGSYAASVATILLYRSQAGLLRRFAVGGVDPNDLAMTLALAVPMAWYLGTVYRHPILRFVSRAYLPVGLLALGLTGSRGGMIVAFVSLSIIPLSMTKLTPGRLTTALATLVLTGALAAVYVPDKVVERLATTQNEVESASFGGRFKLWVAGLNAFTQKPLMGYGTGGFVGAIYSQLGDRSLVAHNSYISVLVEEGIIGFLCYAIMLLSAVAALRKLPRVERRFAQVLLGSTLLAMSPLTWEDRKPVWLILGVIMGLAHAAVVPPAAVPVAPPTLRPRPQLVRREAAPDADPTRAPL